MASVGIAEFHIIGNLASTKQLGKVMKLSVASNYRKKVNDEWQDAVRWNTVNIWNELTQKYISENVNLGDLLRITGNVEQSSYEDPKTNEKVYTVELQAGLLVKLSSNANKEDS